MSHRDRVYSGCEVLTLQADGSYHNAGVSMKNGRRMSAWTARAERGEGKDIMAKVKEEKTNVMRVLDQKKIPYTPHAYPHGDGEAPDGVTVARSLGQDPERVFKTLVTRGASGGYYVFDIPVTDTLDLKKAAKAVGRSPSPCSTAGSCSP